MDTAWTRVVGVMTVDRGTPGAECQWWADRLGDEWWSTGAPTVGSPTSSPTGETVRRRSPPVKGGCCGFAWGDMRSAGNPIALRDPAPMHFRGGDVPPSNIHPRHHPKPRQTSAEDAHGVNAPTQFTCSIDEFNKLE